MTLPRKLPLIIFTVIFILFGQYSPGLEKINFNTLFNQSEKKILLEDKLITKCYLKHRGTIHTPNTDASIIVPLTKYTGKDMQSYEMLCMEKAFFRYEGSKKSMLSLYNTLTAFSRLSGMRYYSRTDKKIRALITESYGINSNNIKIADPIHFNIIPKSINYMKVTDNRFGDLTFRNELYNEGQNFILKNVCIEPMEKYFVSINSAEEYQLIAFFLYDPQAKGFFYYSLHAMRIHAESFLKLNMLSPENFANRIRGNTVHMAKLLNLNWDDKIKAFE